MKKKILYIVTKSNFGGAQRYVYELATAMKNKDHDVVVAFGGNGILKDKLEESGIRTVEIKHFQRDIGLSKDLKSLQELWNLYQVEQPDIVHLNSSKAGGSGALVARLAGIKKIIYTTHGWAFLEPHSRLWKTIVWTGSWMTAMLCHKIILVSEYENSHSHFPFINKKTSIIHTAVPDINFLDRDRAREKLFTKTEIEKHVDKTWLTTNAELNNNKNLFYAIDAVTAHNKNSEHKLFYSILGDGELFDQLDNYIKEKGAQDYIKLLGYITDARTYLKAFDIFILPSKKEGLPYAVLEAGAAGLPVIVSKVGGIPEIIDDQGNGLLINPNKIKTLINALEKLTGSPELKNSYGTKLKQKVQAEFTLEEMIQKTISLY